MKFLVLLMMAGLAACKTTATKSQGPVATGPAPSPAPATIPAKKPKPAKIEVIIQSLTLSAPLDKVWNLVSHVEDWGAWNDHVTQVQPGLGLGAGATIAWSWDDAEVSSSIVSVKNGQEFAFKTTAASKRVVMRWVLSKKGANQTEATLRAEVPYGTAGEIMKKLEEEVKVWLEALGSAAVK